MEEAVKLWRKYYSSQRALARMTRESQAIKETLSPLERFNLVCFEY